MVFEPPFHNPRSAVSILFVHETGRFIERCVCSTMQSCTAGKKKIAVMSQANPIILKQVMHKSEMMHRGFIYESWGGGGE